MSPFLHTNHQLQFYEEEEDEQPQCIPKWQQCGKARKKDKSDDDDSKEDYTCCDGTTCSYTYEGCKAGRFVCKPQAKCVREDESCGGMYGGHCCKGESHEQEGDDCWLIAAWVGLVELHGVAWRTACTSLRYAFCQTFNTCLYCCCTLSLPAILSTHCPTHSLRPDMCVGLQQQERHMLKG